MKIVLFQPEIPQNTGNIARTCAATRTPLTLIRPLGFSISDRQLKRAGLDYWQDLELEILDTFIPPSSPTYFLSSKATQYYSDVSFSPDTSLVFGSETSGLPSYFLKKYPSQFITIPMAPGLRSLNLSNAVCIVLYEALRQNKFQF
ncbi:MAG: tRNA (cytidine(34)-2'-O)-methyltransferase [Chlamydiae bacterium]|nr:tRNA (cytidine(34)-2'-O)-methyltransferase [Chlamydiota bacterium]